MIDEIYGHCDILKNMKHQLNMPGETQHKRPRSLNLRYLSAAASQLQLLSWLDVYFNRQGVPQTWI